MSQDTLLYSGTIRDNILYGLDGNISEEEFKKAADAACVTEFASRMEDGFDTQVGEGGNKLSGGQRQRIGIARAILRNPELLLLDEVTANLDAESEEEVRRALKNVMAGRTVVEVAHRLDAVQDADQIIVLANGQLQGCGRHPELLKNNELYHNMVDIQRQSYGLEMRCDA